MYPTNYYHLLLELKKNFFFKITYFWWNTFMPPPALQQPIKGLTSGSMKWSANKDDDGKKTPIYWGCVGKSACHYLKWRELSLHTALEKIEKVQNIAIKKWQIGLLPKKANCRKISKYAELLNEKKSTHFSTILSKTENLYYYNMLCTCLKPSNFKLKLFFGTF